MINRSRHVSAADDLGDPLKDEIKLTLTAGNSVESVRIGTEDFSSADDRSPDGEITFLMQGRPPKNEDDSLAVGKLLINRFNKDGAHWGHLREETTAWIDCEATDLKDAKNVLQIQVTRVMPQPDYKLLGDSGSLSDKTSPDQLADHLMAAINNKSRKAPMAEVVLALNVYRESRYAFPEVLDAFRRRHGLGAEKSRFKEIWVVSPIEGLVKRLDSPSRPTLDL